MVHFELSSHHAGISEPTKLERSLTGKFRLNPLATYPEGSRPDNPLVPFLPNRCLGDGCALWALSSSVASPEEFFTRMEMEVRHGGWLAEDALMYASMSSLEEIAEKYGTMPERVVEHPAEHPPRAEGQGLRGSAGYFKGSCPQPIRLYLQVESSTFSFFGPWPKRRCT